MPERNAGADDRVLVVASDLTDYGLALSDCGAACDPQCSARVPGARARMTASTADRMLLSPSARTHLSISLAV